MIVSPTTVGNHDIKAQVVGLKGKKQPRVVVVGVAKSIQVVAGAHCHAVVAVRDKEIA